MDGTRAARAVAAHHKLLRWRQAGAAGELSHDEGGDAVGGVALVGIRLDNEASVHLRAVRLLVLARVVWVHRVRHVRRDDKRVGERGGEQVVGEGAAAAERGRDAPDSLAHHRDQKQSEAIGSNQKPS